MELSTVIVNYRSREPLLQCLEALEADAADLAHEIVIVDNDPEKGTIAAAGARHANVRGIANDENVGFARAVNQGIAATTGTFVLLMNPDCVLERGAIATLI